MFDIISDQELRRLAAIESPQSVSLYLPTSPAGKDAAAGPIRLKNLMTEAKSELQRLGMRSSDAADVLAPIDAMVRDARFWAQADAGLAVFATTDEVMSFRLPGPVDEAHLVSDRLWIAPLLPFVTHGPGFYVLALSRKAVRLLEGGRYQVRELDRGEIPADLAEVLRYDDRESQLHTHGADRVGGRVTAAFHGHGGADDFNDVDLGRFLHAVDRGFAKHVQGDHTRPLVLAGVEEIVSEFRKASSYPNIADSFIRGNPEPLSNEQLHERAVALVEAQFTAAQRQALETFVQPSSTTADAVGHIVDAATKGRVSHLLIAHGRPVWGAPHPETGREVEHEDRRPGDHDLVDRAARETLGHGGHVFVVDTSAMPVDGPMAAVLRY